MPKLTRRSLLVLGGGAIGGTALLSINSQEALGTHIVWDVSNLSADAPGGTVNDITLDGSTSSMEFEWSDFDTPPTVNVTIELRASDDPMNDDLSAAAHTYETILSSTYSLPTTSGTTSIGFETLFSATTFPISLLSRHSGLSATDFEPAEGTTLQRELLFRVTGDATDDTSQLIDPALVEITHTPAGVSGVVTYDGSPVQGVKVYVVNSLTNTLDAVAVSDVNGAYSANVGADEYHVMVRHDEGGGMFNTEQSKAFVQP